MSEFDSLVFSEDQVSALTGLSKRRLRYWDREHGFFSPEFTIDGRRVYSFRDLVGLRTVAPLRERVSLQQLRKIDEEIHKEHETPWASLKFYLAGKEIVYRDPRSERLYSATKPGERVIEIDLEEVRNETTVALREARRRSDAEIGTVSRRRNVMRGKAVLAGTRIPTELIWEYKNAGFSVDKILQGFPRLTREDVTQALAYERRRRKRKRAG